MSDPHATSTIDQMLDEAVDRLGIADEIARSEGMFVIGLANALRSAQTARRALQMRREGEVGS